jgi:hypothetical protein
LLPPTPRSTPGGMGKPPPGLVQTDGTLVRLDEYAGWQRESEMQSFSRSPAHGLSHGVQPRTTSLPHGANGVHWPVAGSIAKKTESHDRAEQCAATHCSPLPHSLEVVQGVLAHPATNTNHEPTTSAMRFMGSLRTIRRPFVQRMCHSQVPGIFRSDLVRIVKNRVNQDSGAVNFPGDTV